jgi:hypothetical protein
MNAKLRNFIAISLVVSVVGCDSAKKTTATTSSNERGSSSTTSHAHEHGEEHSHGDGPHGGLIIDWGGGKFHAEFLVDHAKQEATVFVLGSDEKTPAPVRVADDKLLLTIREPWFQVDLLSEPLSGESTERSSRFVGKHERLGVVQEFAGTIVGEVNSIPYAGDFDEAAGGHHDH